MPSARDILEQLSSLAGEARGVAVFWHVVVLASLLAVGLSGARPAVPVAAGLSVGPLVSAAAAAFVTHNPFNGVLMGGCALLLLLFATRIPQEPLRRGPTWAVVMGSAAILYALVYPHFHDIRRARDIFFAPVGVVPCPSLALVLGLGLLGGGFSSRSWSLCAASVATFYALFGMFRLGVWLDAGLLVAAGALAVEAIALGHGGGRQPRLALPVSSELVSSEQSSARKHPFEGRSS